MTGFDPRHTDTTTTMAHIVFYEKPGCGGNAKQRTLLEAAGHTLDRRSLLTEPWTPERLLAFFGERPVAQWFNRAAPRVKSGEVVPEALSREQALALMLAEPLLIRRPLMQREDGGMLVGFETDEVERFVGLRAAQAGHAAGGSSAPLPRSLEGCAAAARHPDAPVQACPVPGGAKAGATSA